MRTRGITALKRLLKCFAYYVSKTSTTDVHLPKQCYPNHLKYLFFLLKSVVELTVVHINDFKS